MERLQAVLKCSFPTENRIWDAVNWLHTNHLEGMAFTTVYQDICSTMMFENQEN